MIGTQENAEIAKSLVILGTDWDGFETFNFSPADGWHLLGSGAYRVALLGPDGVVYKVSYFTEGEDDTENAMEYENFILLSALVVSKSSGKCRLAKSHYFESVDVIAMEYVEKGSVRDWSVASVFSAVGLYDVHAGNAWFDSKGILTLFDYVA